VYKSHSTLHFTQPWPFPHTLDDSVALPKLHSTEHNDGCHRNWKTALVGRDEVGQMLTAKQDLKNAPPMAIAHQLIKMFMMFRLSRRNARLDFRLFDIGAEGTGAGIDAQNLFNSGAGKKPSSFQASLTGASSKMAPISA